MTSRSEPYDLVIFDCDGVLVDSERLGLGIDVEAFAALGWPLSGPEIVDRYVGRSWTDQLADIEVNIGHPVSTELLEWWQQRRREVFAAELTPVDGVREALERIGLPVCVASSSGHPYLERVLRQVGLYDRFAGRVFSASDVERGKPEPDLFLHAAATLGADPSACAVVEDSEYGVMAARAAGMTAFAYTGGVVPAERLLGERTVAVGDLRELPELLQASAPATP